MYCQMYARTRYDYTLVGREDGLLLKCDDQTESRISYVACQLACPDLLSKFVTDVPCKEMKHCLERLSFVDRALFVCWASDMSSSNVHACKRSLRKFFQAIA